LSWTRLNQSANSTVLQPERPFIHAVGPGKLKTRKHCRVVEKIRLKSGCYVSKQPIQVLAELGNVGVPGN
jgi:hypothetical protein